MRKTKKTDRGLWLIVLSISLGLNVLALVYVLKPQVNKLISKSKGITTKKETANLFDEINPVKGFTINSKYGDLGPKMISSGVIDLDKFKQTYEKSGQPLTKEQLEILTEGSNKEIRIDRDNSYFLLNFFWAAGLGNKTKILTDGEMAKYGDVSNFASTGGWTLAKSNPMDYYSKSNLIPMTSKQEDLVQKVAGNIYRPCCNNSTAFPDCNHGMALLSVLELMAASGATEKQMFEAGKYFNAFWFPGNYYDLALYFKNKEGKNFRDVPAEVILRKDYSSASGWSKAKQWLADKGIIQQPPKQGGSCGV